MRLESVALSTLRVYNNVSRRCYCIFKEHNVISVLSSYLVISSILESIDFTAPLLRGTRTALRYGVSLPAISYKPVVTGNNGLYCFIYCYQ